MRVLQFITDLEETYKACRERLRSSHSTREREEGKAWLKIIEQRLEDLSTVGKAVVRKAEECKTNKGGCSSTQRAQLSPANLQRAALSREWMYFLDENEFQDVLLEFRDFYWGLFTDAIRHRKSVSSEDNAIQRHLKQAFEDLCGPKAPVARFVFAMVLSSGTLLSGEPRSYYSSPWVQFDVHNYDTKPMRATISDI
ncbi:MAG: hypothetical protein M1822_003442 [Bathelium mastoideum]|nr:MAG: hypothetical protein M1822_003442 [Bathelium mastoideum]